MKVEFVNLELELLKMLSQMLSDACNGCKKNKKSEESPADESLTYDILVKEYARLNGADYNFAGGVLRNIPDYLGFQALLRSAAVILDRKYPDHINNANVDKYYTIDMSNGRVCEVPKSKVKNFRHFAAFRSLEDIKKATKALRPFMKHLWPNE